MQSFDDDESKKKNLKRSRSSPCNMPVTDSNIPGDCILFPVEEILQYPLPGYVAPTSISFSPDDNIITYLFCPDHTLNRKVFVYDLKTSKQELFFSPPDGGLDECNISAEEKLRERLRERGLGFTWYERVKTSSKRRTIMVPLPAGYISRIFPLQNRSLNFLALQVRQLLILIYPLMVQCLLLLETLSYMF